MNAFFLIDKPLWITSFDIIRQLKKIFWIKRIGHTGTLDPLATGLVLIAMGNYTKLIPYFEKDKKTYEFIVRLDGTTASYDLEQPVEYISLSEQENFKQTLTQEKIQTMLQENFLWEISQVPPKYSAIKINGQKALEKVRKWQDFEMKSRVSTVFAIDILEFSYPEIKIRATVSAGTYIRSIASDLWKLIGTGWYVTFLRRTKIEDLSVESAAKLEDFPEVKPFDINQLFAHIPCLELSDTLIKRLDQWLPTNIKLWVVDGEYFVKNAGNITHIVKYYDWVLASQRKI